MSDKLITKIATFWIITIMTFIPFFLSCHSVDTQKQPYTVKPDPRLLKIIDQYIESDTSHKGNKLITLTVLNNRICQSDYSLTSVNYILYDIFHNNPPSKYFEYKGKLCIIIDSADLLFISTASKSYFQKLIRRNGIPVNNLGNYHNSYSYLHWYIKFSNDSLIVQSDSITIEFPCNGDDNQNIHGLP